MQNKVWISVWLCGLLILGVGIGYWWQPDLETVVSLAGGSLLGLGLVFWKTRKARKSIFYTLLFVVSGINLGMLILCLDRESNQDTYFGFNHLEAPQRWTLRINTLLKKTDFSSSYLATVEAMDNTKASGTLLLRLPTGARLQIDDRLWVFGQADSIPKSIFPNSFDYQKHMAKRDVHFALKVTKDGYKRLPGQGKSLLGHVANFRNRLILQLEKHSFEPRELEVIKALLLGARSNLSPETYSEYQKAGAVHILAVSGLHIGIVLWLLQWVLRPFWLLPNGQGRYWIMGFSLTFIWAYALLAGLSPSILRATLMFSFLTYAYYSGRISNVYNILALSAFFTLLLWPRMLFELGFQLSYSAVLAIAIFYKPFQSFWSPKSTLLRKAWQLLTLGIAAQLGVLPLSLFYFHQFPGLFFISNLIIVPAMGLVLGSGFVILILSYFEWLPEYLVTTYAFLIKSMNQIVAWVAQQERFLFTNIHFDQVQLGLSLICLFYLGRYFVSFKTASLKLSLIGVILLQTYSIVNLRSDSKQNANYIWHEYKTPQLIEGQGRYWKLHKNDSIAPYGLANLMTANHGASLSQVTLQNQYHFKGRHIYRMDSSGIIPTSTKEPLILWLSQSPRVHLGKVLDSLNPEQVVADGSNYPSFITRWKATCAQRNTPFHHTGEKGVFRIQVN